jgi:hypothetical protein
MKRSGAFLLAAALSVPLNLVAARADPVVPVPEHRPQQAAEKAPAGIDARLVLVLVRNVFVAVGQAIASGNYSVLRDLSAPGFRRSFPGSRLVAIFAPLARQQIDFASTVLMVPQMKTAEVNANGALSMSGRMPTEPEPISFEFVFQPISGSWQLLGISMTADMPAQPAAPTAK